MRLDKRTVKLAGLALTVAFLSASSAAYAESEAGGFVIGGGSEAGGVYGTGGENETAGVLWGEGSSETGGANDSGAESDSGGVAASGTESESGGPEDTGAESQASYDGTNMNEGRYVQYYGP
ncbi:MAG: hypothetical protein R3D26_09215 [Cyanobacteriota/Melainabacteria group bacterium]